MSTQVYGRSPTDDKLECGCNANAQARIDTLVLANNASEAIEQSGTWVHEVARAMDEQLREDDQELKTREQKKKQRMQRGYAGLFMKTQVTCKIKWADSCIMTSRNCSACGKDIGMTTKAGGLTRGCAPMQDVKRWSTSVATRCTREYPEIRVLRQTGKASIKTGWAETDKGQPGTPKVRARWVAKAYKTHARRELYASTPPLEALKVVLSEIATGKRGGKGVALVDLRRAYFFALARRRRFVELPPDDHQAGDEHTCGLLQYKLVRHARRRTTVGGRAGIDTQRSQVDERECVSLCVARLHQGRTHRGNRARRRHHNRERVIGGGNHHQSNTKKVRNEETGDW